MHMGLERPGIGPPLLFSFLTESVLFLIATLDSQLALEIPSLLSEH